MVRSFQNRPIHWSGVKLVNMKLLRISSWICCFCCPPRQNGTNFTPILIWNGSDGKLCKMEIVLNYQFAYFLFHSIQHCIRVPFKNQGGIY